MLANDRDDILTYLNYEKNLVGELLKLPLTPAHLLLIFAEFKGGNEVSFLKDNFKRQDVNVSWYFFNYWWKYNGAFGGYC